MSRPLVSKVLVSEERLLLLWFFIIARVSDESDIVWILISPRLPLQSFKLVDEYPPRDVCGLSGCGCIPPTSRGKKRTVHRGAFVDFYGLMGSFLFLLFLLILFGL